MTDTTASLIKSPVEDAFIEVLKRGIEEILAKAVEAKVIQGAPT